MCALSAWRLPGRSGHMHRHVRRAGSSTRRVNGLGPRGAVRHKHRVGSTHRAHKLVGESQRVLPTWSQATRSPVSSPRRRLCSHFLALDVLVDASLSWKLLVPGGTLVFDDYDWAALGDDPLLRPGPAIDAFLTLIAGKYSSCSSNVRSRFASWCTDLSRVGNVSRPTGELASPGPHDLPREFTCSRGFWGTRAAGVETSGRTRPLRTRLQRVRDPRGRLAVAGRARPRRVHLRLGPALRPRRAPAVVDAVPDAGDAGLRRGGARRLRRPLRRAADGAPVRRLDRLLGGGRQVLRSWAAIAVAAVLLLYQGYALMFHEISSEPVFAAAFALWALLLTRAWLRPVRAPVRPRRPR